jgi:F-type H+-transporting ATPase subunit b
MIDELQNRSEENEKGIEQGMAQARKEGYVEKENFKGQGLEEEKGIIQVASTTVEEKIASARKEMEKKIAEARKGLEGEMTDFSNELAEKILGRAIQ